MPQRRLVHPSAVASFTAARPPSTVTEEGCALCTGEYESRKQTCLRTRVGGCFYRQTFPKLGRAVPEKRIPYKPVFVSMFAFPACWDAGGMHVPPPQRLLTELPGLLTGPAVRKLGSRHVLIPSPGPRCNAAPLRPPETISTSTAPENGLPVTLQFNSRPRRTSVHRLEIHDFLLSALTSG
ncbi:hypothetical protein N657DRAFT_63709 [Parathielavia appendiculata]|uniref:Uncharacterized protein n=1 Tax=Parathielavia appendiculata TaxID=2587402 RepID=A0AAN6UA45_9PEZI|nr:hypothetical protein N657DRAFT_63709 [Parathielavia appendiculata]